MFQNHKRHAFGIVLTMLMVLPLFACQTEPPVDSTESLVISKTQEMFTRIKVRDYAVIWENEFPYLRQDSPLEEYLANSYMTWYKPDTLVAVQVDSATLFDDSAYIHMMLEWIMPDSTFKVDTIRLRWHYCDDEWIKPTLSILDRQLDYEDELRVYWEAVKQMQEEEAEEDSEE